MTESDHDALVTRIRNALGCGKDLAEDYAKAIEKRPEVELGKVLVRDEAGRIIARVPESVLDQVTITQRAH